MATIGRTIDPEEIARWLLRGNTSAESLAPQPNMFGASPKRALPTTEEEFGKQLDQYYQQVVKPARDAKLLQQQQLAAAAPPAEPGLFERIAAAAAPLWQQKQPAAAAAESPSQEAEPSNLGKITAGVGEAVLSTATGLAGGLAGMGTFGAGAIAAPVLYTMKTPEKRATYWADLVKASKEIGSRMTYEPRTEVGKLLMAAPNAAMETLAKISERASEAPIAKLLLTPDQREALKYAHEIVTIGLLTEGAIKGLGGVRSKIAKFKTEFSLPEPTLGLVTAAEDLITAVQSDPAAIEALSQARQKLVDTLRTVSNRPEQPLPVTTSATSTVLSTPKAKPAELYTKILDSITGKPESTVATIASELGVSKTVINLALGRMQKSGTVSKSADGKYSVVKAVEPSLPISISESSSITPTEMVAPPGSIIESSNIMPTEVIPPSVTTPIPIIDTTPAIAKPKRVRAPRKKIEVTEPTAALTPEPEAITMVDEGAARGPAQSAELYRVLTPPEGSNLPDVPTAFKQIQRMYSSTNPATPADVRAYLEAAGYSPDAARRGADIGYDMYLRRNNLTTPEDTAITTPPEVTTTMLKSTEQVPTTPLYKQISGFPTKDSIMASASGAGGTTSPIQEAIQVRTINGVPTALLVDTTGLYSIQSLESIRSEVVRGRMSSDVARVLENNLAKQAKLGGVPLEQAHNFTGDRLLSDATQLAYENNLELYRARRTKAGTEYEQIPREAIEVAAKLHTTNLMEPVALRVEDAATYVAEKSKAAGPAILGEIKAALDTLTDISDTLPTEIVPHFRDLLEAKRNGLDVSSPRNLKEIFQDILDVILPYDPTELGSLSLFGLSDARKAAALRLWGDLTKKNKSFKDLLDKANLPEAEKVLFMRYIDAVRKPDLPVGITAPELRFDPRQGASTNPIMHQRTIRRKGVKVPQTPLHWTDLEGAYNAKDLPAKGIQGLTAIGPFQFGAANVSRGANVKPKTFLEPFYALRRADWMELLYAYRASERAGVRETAMLQKDLDALTKVHNRASLERIGEDGYSNSLQGMQILIKNGKDIPTLNANERVTANALRNLFDETWLRINEVREATGKPLLDYVEDYMPFQRAMSLAEKLGEPINLLSSSPGMIFGRVNELANLQFPREIARTGATYRADFNAFRLTQDFMRQALPQIHMEPFLAKLRELISEALPDPNTGKATWRLSEQKPQLYAYLQDWHSRITTGIEPSFSPIGEKIVNVLMRGISGAILFGPHTVLAQLNTLKTAAHAIGPYRLAQGGYDAVADAARYFFTSEGTKIGELFQESQILDTRGVMDAYDGVANALIGGSAKDFMAALRSGELRRIERSFDNTAIYKAMNIFDSMAAIITGLGAKRLVEHIAKIQSSKGLPVMDKIAQRNFVDNIIVQANGGTMPGDMASAFRSTRSRALLQFQRMVVHEWNYWIEDVFGAAGRKEIAQLLDRDPNKYLPAVVKSIFAMVAATTISNMIYENGIGTKAPNPTPIKTALKSIDQNDSKMVTAGKVALEFVELIPGLSSVRYGKGVGGPIFQTIYEAEQTLSGAPMAYNISSKGDTVLEATARFYGSPVAKLLGFRGAGLVGKIVQGEDRGQGVWPSLLGMYQPAQSSGGRRELRRLGNQLRQMR